MATAAASDFTCNLDRIGSLELDHRAYRDPLYISLVVLTPDMVMVVDGKAKNLRLHNLEDGQLLAVSERLEYPRDICICRIHNNEIEVAVCLQTGQIEILSTKSTGEASAIIRTRQLNVRTEFDSCDGVKYQNENLIVCGPKGDNMCWGIVSITNGHVDNVQKICSCKKGNVSYLCTNPRDNMVYISCHADKTGVYGYRNSKLEFLYDHEDLIHPRHVTVDREGFVFISNMDPSCIHHVTGKGQLVTIYREGIPLTPWAIFMEEQQGLLYITSWKSNVITKYRPVYRDPIVPAEILQMDTRSLHMYKEALRDGKEKVYNIRVMVVGQYGVGKTTLTRRLLGKDVNISHRTSTEGIDVDIECCRVSLATGEWTAQDKNAGQYFRLQRLVKLLNECVQKQQEEKREQPVTREMGTVVTIKEYDNRHPQHDQPASTDSDSSQDVQSTSSQPVESPVLKVEQRPGVEHIDPEKAINIHIGLEASENEKTDTVLEILRLVNKNAAKLEKSEMEYAALAMWDFAGQYLFYTAHQTFLTSRAVYLLVIDLSQHVTDIIQDDECFLDMEGIKPCTVHDLMQIWMNSIHSCAPSLEAGTPLKAGIPPVILVGTHADKIPEESREKVIKEYFMKVREMLSDTPIILHLMDDIAIDNTLCDPDPDPRLKDLQKMIFQLAKKQPYWGEEKPARWLPLEQAIMTLKASGVKVVLFSLVEEINRSGSVRIESRSELDLFLRFQHEIGTILYFSVEGLREKIMLDPQWMIDALKSLITAEAFIKKTPAFTNKWKEFKRKGKLTHELLDAIWSKENSPEFHDHKEYIVLLMEKLNIIARPRSNIRDGKEIKVDDYFLAPFMLRETTPGEVISPKPQPDKESSSVLCYVFVEKFLPTPIFHRLLAACVARWPIAQMNSENQIFCGCGVFDLDLHHRLTMFFRQHVIFVRVTRMGTTEKALFSQQCIEAKEFITMTLSNIIGSLGHSLRFELFIRCPKSDGCSVNCLIPITNFQKHVDVPCHFHGDSHVIISREVLKFWFQEEGWSEIGDIEIGKLSQTGDIDPTEEASITDNKNEKLHQKVLNRCLPDLVKDLNFRTVSRYIQQNELFDVVTMRDILEQRTTTEQITELIQRIQQRDQETYEKFKDCLVKADQAFLKVLLEKEEATVTQGKASTPPEPTIL